MQADTPDVFIKGAARPGVVYSCGHCDEGVAAEGVQPHQVCGLIFQCARCRGHSAFPELPDGHNIPAHSVVILPGRYQLKSVALIKEGVLVAEHIALSCDRVHRRFGGTFQSPSGPLATRSLRPIRAPIDSSRIPRELRALLMKKGERHVRALDRAEKLRSPSRSPHRLAELVRELESNTNQEGEPGSVLNAQAWAEGHALVEFLDRWQHHPFLSQLPSLVNSEYQHTVATLTTVSLFEDQGNRTHFVGWPGSILQSESGLRIPDMLLLVDSKAHIRVEVKSPLELWAPVKHQNAPYLVPGNARLEKIIEKAIKNSSGQLGVGASVLVIGGVFNESVATNLENAANVVLQRRNRNHNLACISIVSLGYSLSLHGNDVIITSVPKLSIWPRVRHRVARNPSYVGDVPIITSVREEASQ